MKRALTLLSLTLALGPMAQAQQLQINGQRVPGSLLTLNGQRYVPLSALLAAGFQVSTAGGLVSISSGKGGAVGGANPLAAQSGCLNQTLSNGVWQVKFSNLRFVQGPGNHDYDPYWAIDIEAHNTTSTAIQGFLGGLNTSNLFWVGADGNTWSGGGYGDDNSNGQKVTFNNFPPGGVYRGELTQHQANVSGGASKNRPPVKLLWQIDASKVNMKLPWSGKDASFRVDLTCSK